MFDETRAYLRSMGLPGGDLHDLPSSKALFDDGAHFRIEIPTVNSLETLYSVLDESVRLDVRVNRITETQGMFRYTKNEIKEWASITNDYNCELMMSVGPRATYDTGASVLSAQGKTVGYRLRGQEQLIRAIEDVKRGIGSGISNFLIYDEGLLWILNQMRQSGIIPKYVKFKISAHCGHCNPAAIKILESLGADSVNPVRDLHLSMLSAIRSAIKIPLDCHTDNPIGSGGFIRTYEAPEIVRVASPVYLKTGNSVLNHHGSITTANDGKLMAKQASVVIDIMEEYNPNATQSATVPTNRKISIVGGTHV